MSETEEKVEEVLPKAEVLLVGGSKDGTVTSFEPGLQTVQNIVLNEDFTGPEYVDLYESSGRQDRDGKTLFVHTGRYNAEESKEFWESLDKEQVDSFIEAAKEERAAEAKAAEEAAAAEAEAEETEVTQNAETGEVTEEKKDETEEESSEKESE